uniref:Uncharacterized protein n=1 Tax=Brassica campestris TaxID=3711 RepID=M4CGU2_BRACM
MSRRIIGSLSLRLRVIIVWPRSRSLLLRLEPYSTTPIVVGTDIYIVDNVLYMHYHDVGLMWRIEIVSVALLSSATSSSVAPCLRPRWWFFSTVTVLSLGGSPQFKRDEAFPRSRRFGVSVATDISLGRDEAFPRSRRFGVSVATDISLGRDEAFPLSRRFGVSVATELSSTATELSLGGVEALSRRR